MPWLNDKRDYDLARKYKLKIVEVIKPGPKKKRELPYVNLDKDDKLINSRILNDLSPFNAKKIIIDEIVKKKLEN